MELKGLMTSTPGQDRNAGFREGIAGSGLSVDELRDEIRRARFAANGGVIGVNIMVAVRKFKELVQAALEEGIDLVIAGAQEPRLRHEGSRLRGKRTPA